MVASPLQCNSKFLYDNLNVPGHSGLGRWWIVTVNASDQVTVAHTGHPFSNGDTVTLVEAHRLAVQA